MAKSVTGTVSSDKGDKTIVVTTQERKTHPLYKKQYSVTKKFMAHDEDNSAQVGDRVIIAECRPVSARKHYRLERIVERAGVKFEEKVAAVEEVEAITKPKAAAKAEAKAAEEAA